MRTWLLLLGLVVIGCSKRPPVEPPAVGPAPEAKPTGPSFQELAARAAITNMGGQFDKQVAFGTKGLRIDFGKTPLSDDDIAVLVGHLKDLPTIDDLDLSGTAITSAGLKHFKGVKNLRIVALPTKLLDDLMIREIRETNPHFQTRKPL